MWNRKLLGNLGSTVILELAQNTLNTPKRYMLGVRECQWLKKKHQCGCWGNGGKETSPLSPKRRGAEKARKTLDKSEGFKTQSPTWLLFRPKEALLPSTRFWLWGPGTSWLTNAQGYAVLNSSCKSPPVNSYFTKHRTCPRAVDGKRRIEAGVGVGGWRWWSDSYSRKGEKGWGVVGDGVWRDWQRRTTGGHSDWKGRIFYLKHPSTPHLT